jgi:acyl dehydratase
MSGEAERFPRITPEALAELRSRIGTEFSGPEPYITEANADAIRHFADGVGDRNPLWRDPEYAAKTRWGTVLAPPTILFAFDRVLSGYIGGMPGIHAMYAGTDFRWRRPVRLGDKLKARPVLSGVREMKSQFSAVSVLQSYTIPFRDAHGELVCEAESWVIRTQRDEARRRTQSGNSSHSFEPSTWTREQMAAIAAAYRAERPRGAEPRFWEDVKVGDALDERLKGPATVTSFIAWDLGWGGLYIKAHGVAQAMFDGHPALGIINDQGVPEPPESVHWSNEMARAVGVPAAYDYGPERISWLAHLVTDWMGDDGELRRLNVQVRKHNVVGDLTRCNGRVLRTYREGGEHLVECEVHGVNQRGERNCMGMAVVALPSRSERR